MYVSKALVLRYGKTEGCPGCRHSGPRSVAHSEACRERIKKKMAEDEQGREGLEKEERRQEKRFLEEVDRQVQRNDVLRREQQKHDEQMQEIEQANAEVPNNPGSSSSSSGHQRNQEPAEGTGRKRASDRTVEEMDPNAEIDKPGSATTTVTCESDREELDEPMLIGN